MNLLSEDKERQQQAHNKKRIAQIPNINEKLIVYDDKEYKEGGQSTYIIFSLLVPLDMVNDYKPDANAKDFIEEIGRNMEGFPGISIIDGNPIYFRYGNTKNVIPLVFKRSFCGIKRYKTYIEINEEFRFFHNLYHRRTSDNKSDFIKIFKNGTEETIAACETEEHYYKVEIRLKELRQLLGAKDMALVIHYTFNEHSEFSMNDLGYQNFVEEIVAKKDYAWTLRLVGDAAHVSTRLSGIRIIKPLPKEKCGLYGYEEQEDQKKQYEDFIVGTNDDGEDIRASCQRPFNVVGSNGATMGFFTPVFFNMQVLEKYYNEPDIYMVQEGYFRCGGLWGISIDNFNEDGVRAWLGDLGRLPHNEQLHWKSYNEPPSGSLSPEFAGSQLQAQFIKSNRPTDLLKDEYDNLQKVCNKHLSWQILKPLEGDNRNIWNTIRVPASNNIESFNNLISNLTKIVNESFNVTCIKQLLHVIPKEAGSITLLDNIFKQNNAQNYSEYIELLRKLQNYRSRVIAHPTAAKKEKKAKQELLGSNNNYIERSRELLNRIIDFLKYLQDQVKAGIFTA